MKRGFIFWVVILVNFIAYGGFEDKLKSSPVEKENGLDYIRYFNQQLSCKRVEGTILCTEKEKPFLVRSKEEQFVCFVFLKQQYQQQKKNDKGQSAHD